MSSRPFDPQHDLTAVVALASAAWRAYGPRTYFHPGDVYWRLRDQAWAEGLRLWEDPSGRLVAFASFEPPNDYELQVHPAYWDSSVEQQIMAWAEAQACEAARPGQSPAPATWASEEDRDWARQLEASGYIRHGDCCAHLLCELDGELAAPVAPPGFTLRGVAGESEAATRVDVHRRAFEGTPEPMATATYLRLMQLPGYRPDLDVVAVAPDGRFAAFCLCWVDRESATALLEPVGTAPEFQRLGLGTSVVREGLRRLRGAGAQRAAVVTGAENAGAMRLYQNAGFQVDRLDHYYVRRA